MNAHMGGMIQDSDSGADARTRYEDEDEFEPIYGLPEIPPKDETILWQGEPHILPVLHEVFRIGWVTLYFAALTGWAVWEALGAGMAVDAALMAASVLIFPYLFVATLLTGLAYSVARTTVYTITSKRVIIRAGVALSKAVNIPFAQTAGAQVRRIARRHMDISLQLSDDAKIAYAMLWPHVRPARWKRAQPMLRALPADSKAVNILTEALTAYHGGNASELQVAHITEATGAADASGTVDAAEVAGRAHAHAAAHGLVSMH